MEKALAEGEFIAYYQPKYSTKEQKLIGAEALVRWRRSDGIIVPPYQFVPLFERNGFINKVDRYMFELVCRQQMRWLKQGLYLCQYQSICRGCACMIRILLTNISVF